MTQIVANSGVAQTIVVRRSAFASWLEIDGVMIGLSPDANCSVDIDPQDTPYVSLRIYANRIWVDNCESVAPDDQGGVGYGETESQATQQTAGHRLRVPEATEVSDQ